MQRESSPGECAARRPQLLLQFHPSTPLWISCPLDYRSQIGGWWASWRPCSCYSRSFSLRKEMRPVPFSVPSPLCLISPWWLSWEPHSAPHQAPTSFALSWALRALSWLRLSHPDERKPYVDFEGVAFRRGRSSNSAIRWRAWFSGRWPLVRFLCYFWPTFYSSGCGGLSMASFLRFLSLGDLDLRSF